MTIGGPTAMRLTQPNIPDQLRSLSASGEGLKSEENKEDKACVADTDTNRSCK
jgi:hypothetical protein